MSKRGKLCRYSSLDETFQNSLFNKIVEYHEDRGDSGEDTKAYSLRCAFAACRSATEEKRASDIPETAEEILENLGLSRVQPHIPERFLKDFDERFKDVSDLDSRIVSSIVSIRGRRNSLEKKGYVGSVKNSEKLPLYFGKKRFLTRSKTLMSFHPDSDSANQAVVCVKSPLSEASKQVSDNGKDLDCTSEKNLSAVDETEPTETEEDKATEANNQSEVEGDLTEKQNEYASMNENMEYCDSDSSTYTTPCRDSSCRLSNDREPDSFPEYHGKLRRCSLSCSDVPNLEHRITSEYATLCREFRKFRGLNASDSDIQISLNSPPKRLHSRYNPLLSSDSEDDDILCVILPAIEDEPKKVIGGVPTDAKWPSFVRVVEDCKDCDLCRASSNDIPRLDFDKSVIKQTAYDSERFADSSDKIVNLVTKNNGCNQTDVNCGRSYILEKRMDTIEYSSKRDFERISKEDEFNSNHNNVKKEMAHQKQPIKENITTKKNFCTSSTTTRNKKASTELAELQSVIQNTKVKRESAARQLFLLRELLHGNDAIPEFADASDYYMTSLSVNNDTVAKTQRNSSEALSELQLRAGQKEMQRANSVDALEKADDDEKKEMAKREQELKSQLEKLQKEMEKMRLQNEELKSKIATQKQDSIESEERQRWESPLPSDISFDSNSPPNTPDKPENHLLRKRLKEAEDRAYQAESRSDELNLLLNHKLIEINKLQLTLSSQTKDLIQLEKAYYQLRCHLHKNRKMASPTVRRITSKLNKTT